MTRDGLFSHSAHPWRWNIQNKAK